jgi:hypothetical protein
VDATSRLLVASKHPVSRDNQISSVRWCGRCIHRGTCSVRRVRAIVLLSWLFHACLCMCGHPRIAIATYPVDCSVSLPGGPTLRDSPLLGKCSDLLFLLRALTCLWWGTLTSRKPATPTKSRRCSISHAFTPATTSSLCRTSYKQPPNPPLFTPPTSL